MRTAEYCRLGHPDRMADVIADALVDEFIKQDPFSRVAIDVIGGHNTIYVIGEVSTKGYVDVPKVVKEVYQEIGYANNVGVLINIVEQSPEISNLANVGAGDSGIMVGYATRETPEMLPLEVVLCKKICDELDTLQYLEPDGKVQVTLDDKGGLDTLVVSVQGNPMYKSALEDLLKHKFPCKDLRLIVYSNGGFDADSGLTGRKNVLWYGPQVPTGGGAFAGKDPTKVDRSGAYYARKLAINYLREHSELKDVLIKISFAIGKNEPLEITINDSIIYHVVGTTVSTILDILELRQPIYKQASLLGHFGNKELSWEK